MSYVAGGYAGTQGVRHAWEGREDLLEVVGSSGHGGGFRRDVAASRKGAIFHLRAGDVYGGRERV